MGEITHAEPPRQSGGRSGGVSNPLAIGTRLHEFEVTGLIGEGGFGIVYLVQDHSLLRTVAVKEYMPSALAVRFEDHSVTVRSEHHQSTFDAGLRSFINEAQLLAKFDHPALLKVYRFWEQHGTAYMAMPYYEGLTLRQLIRAHPTIVTEGWLKGLLAPVVDALEVLHAAHCYHRDLSPDNILVLKDGAPVVLDFGAARRIIGEMTQAVTVILKPGYAPVEQYADDPNLQQGPWTDIYALAAVAYFTITNKAPPASVARLIRDPLKPLHTLAPEGFSREFLDGIDLGLAVRPEARPQTMAAFRSALALPSYRTTPPALAWPAAISATGSMSPTTERRSDPSSVPSSAAKVAQEEDFAPISVGAARSSSTSVDAVDVRSHVEPVASASRQLSEAAPQQSSRWRRFGFDLSPISAISVVLFAVLLAIGIGAGIAWLSSGKETPGLPLKVAEPPKSELKRAPSNSTATEQRQLPNSAPSPDGAVGASPASKGSPSERIDAPMPGEKTPGSETASPKDSEDEAWAAIRKSSRASDYESFLTQYPGGRHAPEATAALERLRAPAEVVLINVRPAGEVVIDGVSLGWTPPLKRVRLATGTHFVEVRNPGFPSHTMSLEVQKGDRLTIVHEFK